MDTVRSTKMCVTFEGEHVIDFAAMLENFAEVYDISYAGISPTKVLYLQTSNYRVRMVARKLRKYCEKFGKVIYVSSFTTVPEEVTWEIGVMRSIGRHGQDGTRSTSQDKLLALGREDVSHITVEMLSDIVGTREEVLARIGNNYLSDDYLRDVARQRWNMTRRCHRAKLRGLGYNTSSNVEDDFFAFDPDKFLEENKPGYYAYPDCEENMKMINKIRNEFLLDTNTMVEYAHFIEEFEKLLYKQSSNSNVKASRSLGYFHYFEGSSWVSKNVSEHYFDMVVRSRVLKISEIVTRLHVSTPRFLKQQLVRIVRAYPKIAEEQSQRSKTIELSILNAQNQTRIYKSNKKLKNHIQDVRVDFEKMSQ